MTKRLVSAAASAVAIGAVALALAPSAMATANGGGCQLAGTASFSPNPITGTSQTITYTFSGTLSNCHSGSTSGPNSTPTGGTISTPDPASLTGSCSSSTSSGIAVVQWNDNLTTVESYTTSGAAAAVQQTGKVIASYTAANGTVYTTTEPSTPVGDTGNGLFAFTTSTPQNCAPGGAGLTSAGINGAVFTGSSS